MNNLVFVIIRSTLQVFAVIGESYKPNNSARDNYKREAAQLISGHNVEVTEHGTLIRDAVANVWGAIGSVIIPWNGMRIAVESVEADRVPNVTAKPTIANKVIARELIVVRWSGSQLVPARIGYSQLIIPLTKMMNSGTLRDERIVELVTLYSELLRGHAPSVNGTERDAIITAARANGML